MLEFKPNLISKRGSCVHLETIIIHMTYPMEASGQTLSVQLVGAHISQQLINVHHNIGQ